MEHERYDCHTGKNECAKHKLDLSADGHIYIHYMEKEQFGHSAKHLCFTGKKKS